MQYGAIDWPGEDSRDFAHLLAHLAVASLNAIRRRSGSAAAFSVRRRSISTLEAISASQIAVSAASTWQKKRRRDRSGSRQWRSSRAVTGVTAVRRPASSRERHAATFPRISLMQSLGLRWPCSSSRLRLAYVLTLCFGAGIGTTNSLLRRPSDVWPVGTPLSSSSQWRDGSAKGLFKIGFSINVPIFTDT
jgi:hypothetical protein